MASDNQGEEGLGDDFFEQMLSVPVPAYSGGGGETLNYVGGSGGCNQHHHHHHGGSNQHHHHHGGSMVSGVGEGDGSSHGPGAVGFRGMGLPLGLNLETGSVSPFLKAEDASGKSFCVGDVGDGVAAIPTCSSGIHETDQTDLTSLFPSLGHMQPQLRRPQAQLHQSFQGQLAQMSAPAAAPSHQPPIRPKTRARRGQATDPHSIAERLRRERIAERMKALQELVPSCNKTDRAGMLDEIVDYVKFLRLQVKVLSMSRLGGAAGAVAQAVADVPQASAEGGGGLDLEGSHLPVWERWSTDGTEEQVAKLMEEDIGAAMQFLQSKELCIMSTSLASALFQDLPQDTSTMVKPESNNPL